MKILICDPTNPDAIAQMRKAGIEVDVRDDISADDLLEVIPAYNGMVVRSRTKVTPAVIDAATHLKLVIRGGVGLDNIDVKYAESKGIEVRNTPAASSNSVAELTIGFLFALVRQIPQVNATMKQGAWEKKAYSKGTELSGKTLGLIGLGRIGGLTAQKANALGMEVIFYRRTPTQVDYATQVSLDELFARSDFISLHVPHTPETHTIIDAEAFEKMREGVYVVNCGRGGTLDEAALYEAIKNGKVAGAALDVYEDEKVERGKRFMDLPQVIGSPHIGAGTKEASDRVGAQVAQIAIEVANR